MYRVDPEGSILFLEIFENDLSECHYYSHVSLFYKFIKLQYMLELFQSFLLIILVYFHSMAY